ncbi:MULTISPECIES: metallophosphoesterase family protein [Phyllobacteriaceae]|uniref:Metallophosphatase n=1 Tax=Mesorhizobium hungaricum TaxID=1566387 RepID=A0A1C2E1D1_9HYPH|nr:MULTISPECIES: metallophosphoesterase family protein [Mesorhizobium]MBN9235675.1 serine/threonine protein phosphatase [Mesorhizobium sp.]OCX20824.1 metallophosphatase [Mesorhizobium hungaricum]
MRLYAIGDVHGRLDLLTAMHERIAAELERDRPADWRIVHLGDYVDRGPDSKGVIDFLIAAQQRDPRMIALAGNHDIGFLDFLAMPDAEGLFARYGGRETALSYGVAIDFSDPASVEQGWKDLVRAVSPEQRRFLHELPYSASFGDFFFCHAGVRPGIALERQAHDDLIWIRTAFHNHPGLYEKIIVHGHTPQPEAELMPNRVNVDTGAWQTGILTALVVDGVEKRVLTATG